MSIPIRGWLKMLATYHRPSGEPDVFIHSLPRSGSTWLMELVLTQPGFRACPEPLNIRKEVVVDHLGLREWSELHRSENRDKVRAYVAALASGRLRDPRFSYQAPWKKFYRPITKRNVFKVIHAAEEYINELAVHFNGHVLFLIRHPIPVSLSRVYYPKLDTILNTDFKRYFTDSQLDFAKRIIASDSKLERGILDWCLRNSVALRSRSESWTIVTYEQLVLDPAPALAEICKRCELPEPGLMLDQLSIPSGSTALSSHETRELLSGSGDLSNRHWLVEKWRPKVTEADFKRASRILEEFGLDRVYRAESATPEEAYWIR